MTDHEYHGHMTKSDGSHVPLSADEAKALWELMERRQAERAALWPDTLSALSALSQAQDRLRELGWGDSRHCPRNGAFAVCELGSTGIWTASFWRDYIHYGDAVSNPGPHMFWKTMFWKPLDALTEAEKATMAECAKSDAEYIDRLGRSYGMQEDD